MALATALGALALAAAAAVPAHAATCDQIVAVGAPVEPVINAASPGQSICLRGGVHTAPDREFRITARGAGTLGSADTSGLVLVRSHPGELATLHGRLVLARESAWVRFMRVALDGSGGPLLNRFGAGETYPSPTVSGHSISFLNVDASSRRTGICFHESPPQWGHASYLRIRYSRIHDCGLYPATNKNHGIYLEVPTSRAQITDNWIYDNADRCLQLYPNADGALVQRNVMDGCGEGVLFGGSAEDGTCAASDRNLVQGNVISNARERWLVEAWWGCSAIGMGNVVRDNCLWPTNPAATYNQNAGLDGTAGYSASNNIVADPRFVDRAGKDFRLREGSPCTGRVPGIVPGP